MDEYILKRSIEDDAPYFFYKNGKLHREMGPAFISEDVLDKSKYLNLGDEHLYKIEILENIYPIGFNHEIVFQKDSFVELCHYINGKAYTKKEFKEMKRKFYLKKELNEELPVKEQNNKRLKL